MKRFILINIIFLSVYFISWASPLSVPKDKGWKAKTENADYIHRAMKEVTDVMVYDIYSPPVSSRTYAYISVAAYEALIQGNDSYISLAGQLHGLATVPTPDKNMEYSPTLASVHAILTTAKAFVISEGRIKTFGMKLEQEFKESGMPEKVFDNSLAYGKVVADHIIAWAAKDKYKETRILPAYSISNEVGLWKPTPPAYMKAIEPHWSKLRTFRLDSASQFKPAAPPPFSTDTTSAFYEMVQVVNKKVKSNTDEEIEIAKFWDCNPFKMNVRGHVMYATKKLSPNGHWMGITMIACKKEGASPERSAEAYVLMATTMADCFISCWDEKYRSSLIRPETYINQYIDPNWRPVLQTPPFPEYTSGHSVVSSGACIILTQLFGDNYSFTDTTEEEYGLPARNFTSFNGAAKEAAISRLYGGIHYMPAIVEGQTQGFAIGEFFISKLRTRNNGASK